MRAIANTHIRVQPPVLPRPGIIGLYTNKIHHLRTSVLDVLPRRKFAIGFMKPVDIRRKPEYYTVIKSPMDVETIKQRVLNSYYQNADELLSDLNLIVANHKKMSKSEDPKYRNCLKLEKFIALAVMKMPRMEILYLGNVPSSESDSSTESYCSDSTEYNTSDDGE